MLNTYCKHSNGQCSTNEVGFFNCTCKRGHYGYLCSLGIYIYKFNSLYNDDIYFTYYKYK